MNVTVVIPALNEADCIGDVVRGTLAREVAQVIVVDNGSTDDTASAARHAGAFVVREPRRGYGYACAAGVMAARDAEIVVFMDGDGSFLPQELPTLVRPIRDGRADLVLGSRVLGNIANGSMPPQQRFGNQLTSFCIRALYGIHITDLGPYRAVRRELLNAVNLKEMTYGYPTEMVVKTARQRARIIEVPVSYQARRAGVSKVSGTLRGTVLAGYRILSVTFRYAWSR